MGMPLEPDQGARGARCLGSFYYSAAGGGVSPRR